MNELNAISLRISRIINELFGQNKSEFARVIGIGESNVRSYLRGSIPKADVLEKIATSAAINCEWLLTGKGEMLKQECSTSIVPAGTIDSTQLVPLYDLGMTTEIKGRFIGDGQRPIEHIYIPNLSKCDGAVLVRGNSMAPYLSAGDIILFKHVKTEGIVWGEIYLLAFSIDGNNYVGVRQLKKSDNKGWVTLSNYNHEYKPQDIPLEAIRSLALVKAGVKYTSMA